MRRESAAAPLPFSAVRVSCRAGLQGTNRPAKYSVLRDEVGFSADMLQLLAHWTSHTFVRCPR